MDELWYQDKKYWVAIPILLVIVGLLVFVSASRRAERSPETTNTNTNTNTSTNTNTNTNIPSCVSGGTTSELLNTCPYKVNLKNTNIKQEVTTAKLDMLSDCGAITDTCRKNLVSSGKTIPIELRIEDGDYFLYINNVKAAPGKTSTERLEYIEVYQDMIIVIIGGNNESIKFMIFDTNGKKIFEFEDCMLYKPYKDNNCKEDDRACYIDTLRKGYRLEANRILIYRYANFETKSCDCTSNTNITTTTYEISYLGNHKFGEPILINMKNVADEKLCP